MPGADEALKKCLPERRSSREYHEFRKRDPQGIGGEADCLSLGSPASRV